MAPREKPEQPPTRNPQMTHATWAGHLIPKPYRAPIES
jgi:hypothetical protein